MAEANPTIEVKLETGWPKYEKPKDGDWAKITVAGREYLYVVRITEFMGFMEPVEFGTN